MNVLRATSRSHEAVSQTEREICMECCITFKLKYKLNNCITQVRATIYSA